MINRENFITAGLAIFPEFKAGLEINCGDGLRIGSARRRYVNMWGLNPIEEKSWMDLAIDPFIKIGAVYDIPYPDEFFDFVVYNGDLYGLDDNAIKEIIRVGSDRFVLKMSHSSLTECFNRMKDFGLYPEVMIMNVNDEVEMEVRKNFL